MKLKITSQEFGRGPVSTARFSTLAEASAYIADRWQGDEYRDGPASFHTDYCTYLCHGFTLDQARKPVAPKCAQWRSSDHSRKCHDDSCDGVHCIGCGGHFVDFHNGNLRGTLCSVCQIDREYEENDRDGPGVEIPFWSY